MGSNRRPSRPAMTEEGREDQLISLAYEEAERQMRQGTAPAQIVTHFLKMGSTREAAEQRRLENENLLLSAKVDAMQSAKRVEELMEEALAAFRTYSGQDTGEYDLG
jgi:hypothetical protein